jgi:hypothetical protein
MIAAVEPNTATDDAYAAVLPQPNHEGDRRQWKRLGLFGTVNMDVPGAIGSHVESYDQRYVVAIGLRGHAAPSSLAPVLESGKGVRYVADLPASGVFVISSL